MSPAEIWSEERDGEERNWGEIGQMTEGGQGNKEEIFIIELIINTYINKI